MNTDWRGKAIEVMYVGRKSGGPMIGHVGFRVFRRRRDIIRNPLKPGPGRDINQLMDNLRDSCELSLDSRIGEAFFHLSVRFKMRQCNQYALLESCHAQLVEVEGVGMWPGAELFSSYRGSPGSNSVSA